MRNSPRFHRCGPSASTGQSLDRETRLRGRYPADTISSLHDMGILGPPEPVVGAVMVLTRAGQAGKLAERNGLQRRSDVEIANAGRRSSLGLGQDARDAIAALTALA